MNITISLLGREIARIAVDVAPLVTLLHDNTEHPVTSNGHRVTDQVVGRTMQMMARHMTHSN